MIKSLHIKNYALIESLDVDFSRGLTIITGETGAGKSILLGALGLIMGHRADSKSMYDEDKKCVVEGYFDIRKYEIRDFFSDNDLDYEEDLVIRRELLPSGKSRAFVNDSPVNLGVLQQLSAALIDLHQQFDTLDIHNVSFQLRMIDALAGNKKLLADYEQKFRLYQYERQKLAELIERNENAARETEFLEFQLQELQEAALREEEQQELEEELARLTNAEEIKRNLGGIHQHISESEQSVLGQLQEMGQTLNQIEKYDTRLGQLSQRYQSILLEMEDLAEEFGKLAEETEYDPERIQVVQERLDLIYRLQSKHSVTSVKDLLEIQRQLEKQLQSFADLSSEIENLQAGISQQENILHEIAVQLSENRQAVTADFEQRVEQLLSQLAMEHARLQVDIRKLDRLHPTGYDEVNFLFAANKGSRMQLIKEVASGGEVSRLTLVTKSLVASSIPLPTLIFDEIDSGVSGDVALKMGNILRQLSNEHQVITITHSPQIASKADVHYFVYKEVRDDRTVTKMRQLSDEDRVRAIATMLSQNPPSESAIENARELLSHAG